MQVHHCDICKEVLNDNIYILTVTKYPPPNFTDKKFYESMTIEERSHKLQQSYPKQFKEADTREICNSCFKILTYLFRLRMDKLKKLKLELEKIEKESKK